MHTLVVGRTNSGKTWICKKLAAKFKKQGYKILVLDPMGSGWDCDFITADPKAFLNMVWKSENCILFVDEGGQTIGRFNAEMDRLATQSRHFGHKCFFITQRPKQLSTNVREQCSELITFKQSLSTTKDLADEFVNEDINNAHTLRKCHFIWHTDDDDNPTITGHVKDI